MPTEKICYLIIVVGLIFGVIRQGEQAQHRIHELENQISEMVVKNTRMKETLVLKEQVILDQEDVILDQVENILDQEELMTAQAQLLEQANSRVELQSSLIQSERAEMEEKANGLKEAIEELSNSMSRISGDYQECYAQKEKAEKSARVCEEQLLSARTECIQLSLRH